MLLSIFMEQYLILNSPLIIREEKTMVNMVIYMHSYFKYDTIVASDLHGIYNGSPCKSHTDRPFILYLLLVTSLISHEGEKRSECLISSPLYI